MDQENQRRTEPTGFPRADRSIVLVKADLNDSGGKEYWLRRTPPERLETVELLRQIAHGDDPAATRLQRILETAEFPPR